MQMFEQRDWKDVWVYLSWQWTGPRPAVPVIYGGVAGERFVRPTALPETQAGCRRTESRRARVVPTRRPRRRGPAWTGPPADARRAAEPAAGCRGARRAPYSAPVSHGSRSPCISEGAWRCSSTDARSRLLRFRPVTSWMDWKFPTARRLASPSFSLCVWVMFARFVWMVVPSAWSTMQRGTRSF